MTTSAPARSYLNLTPLSSHRRGYKVEPWEDTSPLLSISRDTSIAASTSRPQRLRTYRDGLAWPVCCTCWLRLLPGHDARARLLAGCREEGCVLMRRDRHRETLGRFHVLLENGASATNRCENSLCRHSKPSQRFQYRNIIAGT